MKEFRLEVTGVTAKTEMAAFDDLFWRHRHEISKMHSKLQRDTCRSDTSDIITSKYFVFLRTFSVDVIWVAINSFAYISYVKIIKKKKKLPANTVSITAIIVTVVYMNFLTCEIVYKNCFSRFSREFYCFDQCHD